MKLFDTVALTEDLPERGLIRGQVGAVIEMYPSGDVEVEFSNQDGETYAQLALDPNQLLVLHHEPPQDLQRAA